MKAKKEAKWEQISVQPTGDVIVVLSVRPETKTYAVQQFTVLEHRIVGKVEEIREKIISGEPFYEENHPELHWAFVIYEEARKALLATMFNSQHDSELVHL